MLIFCNNVDNDLRLQRVVIIINEKDIKFPKKGTSWTLWLLSDNFVIRLYDFLQNACNGTSIILR